MFAEHQARPDRRALLLGAAASPFLVRRASAADPIRTYSIWPESYARPVLEAFEKASGVPVKFVRFSSGEALARVLAERNNPADRRSLRRSGRDLCRRRGAGRVRCLYFLSPSYKAMLQMADARTSGTAVTRIFSILQVHDRNEDAAFAYMKKLRQNVQSYTKSGGGGTVPVGLGQAGGGIFFIVDALFTKQQGYDVEISFPKEGIGSAAECIALIKGAKNPDAGKKLIDWATSSDMQSLLSPNKINFLPANPKVQPDPGLAAVLKTAKIIEIDDAWAGVNRQRIVQRWVAEVLNAG